MPSSIYDPDWKYTPAAQTDIRKTFQRVRRRLAEEAKKKQQTQPSQVILLPNPAKKGPPE